MFQKILLAVALQRDSDYSLYAAALKPVGIGLARAASGEITLLTVFDYEELSHGGRVNILPPDVLEREKELIRRRIEAKLDNYALDFLREGLEVQKLVREGNPREEIIQVAKEIRADLIIIGAHCHRSVFDVLLGKTAESITKNAPCAVVKVSPPPKEHWKNWEMILTFDH
ncbi:MAG: universal stress protein [Candidatus Tectomicrobia bacterium]|uniref:Universal stress protein n=1 Tax=Tectimicrobiota bacterium TaxID=2528274 RepID=A0A932CR51_UNCTE|nr:universal stress protein [Candidatus Tectomicrobia bacterium]